MTIRAHDMTEGRVVCDPTMDCAPHRRFFTLLSPHSEDGPWPAKHLCSDTQKDFLFKDLARLERVADKPFVDIDLRPLLGQRVYLKMEWGNVSGMVEQIQSSKLVALGVEIDVPQILVIDSEPYPIAQIKVIELKE